MANDIDNVVKSVVDNVAEKTTVRLTKKEKDLLELIKVDSGLTIAEMAARVNIDSRAIQRGLRKLRENKIVERIGSDRAGSWAVKKQ
ncbi:MAG: winged helix-turn-helix transcriptional regulator [Christensenellaceae bacterium]|nr:winged helix-turn-helix transcriptional regulator [Christensenellaceae bacterium]